MKSGGASGIILDHIVMTLGCHTLLLAATGQVWAFGWNKSGQLGLGHTLPQSSPTLVPWDGPQPMQLDWGHSHSVILDEEGGVWVAGLSGYETEDSTTFQRVTELPPIAQVSSGFQHTSACDFDGRLWTWGVVQQGTDTLSLTGAVHPLEGLPPILKFACGENFLMAESIDEELWVLES